jgi:hypothetical protein
MSPTVSTYDSASLIDRAQSSATVTPRVRGLCALAGRLRKGKPLVSPTFATSNLLALFRVHGSAAALCFFAIV